MWHVRCTWPVLFLIRHGSCSVAVCTPPDAASLECDRRHAVGRARPRVPRTEHQFCDVVSVTVIVQIVASCIGYRGCITLGFVHDVLHGNYGG